jgi:hypothetical protein
MDTYQQSRIKEFFCQRSNVSQEDCHSMERRNGKKISGRLLAKSVVPEGVDHRCGLAGMGYVIRRRILFTRT